MADTTSITETFSAMGPQPDAYVLGTFESTICQILTATNAARLDLSESLTTEKYLENLDDELSVIYQQVYQNYHKNTTFKLDMSLCMNSNSTDGVISNTGTMGKRAGRSSTAPCYSPSGATNDQFPSFHFD